LNIKLNTKNLLIQNQLSRKPLKKRPSISPRQKCKRKKKRRMRNLKKMMDGLLFHLKKEKSVKTNDDLVKSPSI
jgi:hypothetical protein